MAKPATRDITVYQGDLFSLFFRLRKKLADPTAPAEYIPIPDGSVCRGQVRSSVDAPEVMASFVATISDQTAFPGGVLLTIPPEVTSTLLTDGVYDIEIERSEDDRRTYLAGKVTVLKQVTK